MVAAAAAPLLAAQPQRVTVAATQMACSWDIEDNLVRLWIGAKLLAAMLPLAAHPPWCDVVPPPLRRFCTTFQPPACRPPTRLQRKAEGLVRQAAAAGAQIILLQELFEAPYFCQVGGQPVLCGQLISRLSGRTELVFGVVAEGMPVCHRLGTKSCHRSATCQPRHGPSFHCDCRNRRQSTTDWPRWAYPLVATPMGSLPACQAARGVARLMCGAARGWNGHLALLCSITCSREA